MRKIKGHLKQETIQEIFKKSEEYFRVKQKSEQFQNNVFPDQNPLSIYEIKELKRSIWKAFFKKYDISLNVKQSGNISLRNLLQKLQKLKLFPLIESQIESLQTFRDNILEQVSDSKVKKWTPLHLFFFMCSIYEVAQKVWEHQINFSQYEKQLEKRKKKYKKQFKDEENQIIQNKGPFPQEQEQFQELDKLRQLFEKKDDHSFQIGFCIDCQDDFFQDSENEKEKTQGKFNNIVEDFSEWENRENPQLAILHSEKHQNNVKGMINEY